MASGFSSTLERGHDAVYDYCCTPCSEDSLNAEASFYCRNCSKLFCDTCLRHHNRIHKNHEVLGSSEVDKWGKVKSVTPAMMCKEHPDKEEEVYCGDHDLTCCHICINVYHRTCKQVSHVSTVAREIQKTPEFQSFLSNAASTQTSLRNLLDKRAKNTKLLQKIRNEITSSFEDIRKNLNKVIDNAEKESTTEMDRLLSIIQSKIQYDKDKCSDIEKQIKMFLDNIKNLGNQCEEFAFQSFKKCERKLSTAEELLSSMDDDDYQLRFTPDPSIQQFQASVKSFGKFEITPMNLPPDHVYTVDRIEQYNFRTKTDTQDCIIRGMCQLPDEQVAIVDTTNKKVKLLSSGQYSVTTELDLPCYPYDICTTTGTELVVTVCSWSGKKVINELHFINAAAGHLTHTRRKKLDHECIGIVCHNNQLYVGSRTALYEYSLSGQKIRKIYEDTSSPEITVHMFAVSDDSNRFYVTKPDQDCMLTMNKSGEQLSVLTDPGLKMPSGVCLAYNGAVFVSGMISDTVIQVDREGMKKMITLAKQSDGVYGPKSLCYDRKLKQLLIGQQDNNNLLMLKLK